MDIQKLSGGHTVEMKQRSEGKQSGHQEMPSQAVLKPVQSSIHGTKKEDKKEIEAQVEGLNNMLQPHEVGLKFNVHEKLDRLYVQVVDRKTDDVIREIPPEKFLDMISSMLEHAGLIVDKKV